MWQIPYRKNRLRLPERQDMSNEPSGQATTMKAIVYDRYGSPDVLELKDVEIPTGDDDYVLVRIRAACVNPYDWHMLRGKPYVMRLMVKGPRRSRQIMIPGADMAGVVESVGKDVTRLRPGAEVYGEVSAGCFAEYVSAPEERIALKPTNLSFEQAAAVPMVALTALQGLRNVGRIEQGQKVLVNGASGGIGTFAVQLAKNLGAAEVTGVCSTRNMELVRSIGADHVVDYSQDDFTRGGERYDLLLDTVGNRSLRALRRTLTKKGTVVLLGGGGGRLLGPIPKILGGMVLSRFVGQRIVTFVCKPNKDDLELLKELIETGKVTPVIDRTYPLAEAAAAIRYLEEGHARGKVVITV
jgi:NADPH:quinone reductase-like Zn-dependent oxidoreductase